jgi:hypothetical protein
LKERATPKADAAVENLRRIQQLTHGPVKLFPVESTSLLQDLSHGRMLDVHLELDIRDEVDAVEHLLVLNKGSGQVLI